MSSLDTSSIDVVVIGAGVAGCTMAISLAKQGRSVLLIEKGRFGKDKLCGEFLSPESAALLQKIDCLQKVQSVAASIENATFTGPKGGVLNISLGAKAWGISRRTLDVMLLQQALEQGVWAMERAEVLEIYRKRGRFQLTVKSHEADNFFIECGIVIGAYGRKSRLDNSLGRPFVRRNYPFVGFKQHHTSQKEDVLTNRVEIHTFPLGYCGMSRVEDKQINVCMLLHNKTLEQLPNRSWDNIVDYLSCMNPFLADRLNNLVALAEPMQAVSGVPFVKKQPFQNGVFFIGDAAGVIAPLAGDGQAMALDSAVKLTDLLRGISLYPGDDELQRLGRAWTFAFRRRYNLRLGLSGVLQQGILRPGWSDRIIHLVNSIPYAPDTLLKLTRGP